MEKGDKLMTIKTVSVNNNAKIISGILSGQEGKVVGYESDIDEVWISLDEKTTVLVSSEMIMQK